MVLGERKVRKETHGEMMNSKSSDIEMNGGESVQCIMGGPHPPGPMTGKRQFNVIYSEMMSPNESEHQHVVTESFSLLTLLN